MFLYFTLEEYERDFLSDIDDFIDGTCDMELFLYRISSLYSPASQLEIDERDFLPVIDAFVDVANDRINC